MATFIELFLENSLRRLVRRKIDQKNFILYQQITKLYLLLDGLWNIFLPRILRYSGKVAAKKKKKENKKLETI